MTFFAKVKLIDKMSIKSNIFLYSLILTTYPVISLPNFVLILTDDQDLMLNGLMPMIKTQKLLANEGKTFLHAYVNTPICCPSRSTILTGKYPHNTGVVNNSISGGCSSRSWQEKYEPRSVASILKEEKKYITFYAGKYLNQYGNKECGGTSHVPQGYDWWMGLKGNSKYYNYTLSLNGTAKFFGNKYLTDLLSNYSLQFLDNRPWDSPFFMIVAPPAPHAPFTPAKRHEDIFNGTRVVRTPAFNFSVPNVPRFQKHWIVDSRPRFLPENVTILDKIQEHRFESLLAVDDMVENIVNKLKGKELLANTYVILMSDNGFHLGQFALPWDKRQPYETDIRVPFLIRGPGITKKYLEMTPIAAVDIVPTILDLADVQLPDDLDGESLKKVLFSKTDEMYRKEVLIEYWGEGNSATLDPECHLRDDGNLAECSREQWCKCQDSRNNTYSCLLEISNTNHFKFCRFRDNKKFTEAYNLTTDYFELENIASSLSDDIKLKYENILEKMKSCYGKKCADRQV